MPREKREDGRKAQTVAQNKYILKAYDRINLTVKKGYKEMIQNRAKERGESVNGYINALIASDIPGFATMDGSGAE